MDVKVLGFGHAQEDKFAAYDAVGGPGPPALPDAGHPPRLARGREAAAGRLRARPQPHLARRPDPARALHGRPRRDAALPREGHVVRPPPDRRDRARGRADPGPPEHGRRRRVAPHGDRGGAGGAGRHDLPGGHDHPRPRPLAHVVAHRRGARRPGQRKAARAHRPVGRAGHAVALLEATAPHPAHDRPRARGRSHRPDRLRGARAHRGPAPPGHRPIGRHPDGDARGDPRRAAERGAVRRAVARAPASAYPDPDPTTTEEH